MNYNPYNNPIMEELPNGMIGFMDNPEREPLTKEQFEKLQLIQGGIWILLVEPENYLNKKST
jgi:hypothetical protein